MGSILCELRAEIEKNIDQHTKKSSQRYFKERIRVYGVKTGVISRIAQDYFFKIKDLGKRGIYLLCEELFESGMLEESFIACKWSEYVKDYDEEDFLLFERWVDTYVNNWATCDTLCNHTVGYFIMTYPEYVERLIWWAKSENMWMRRAAAVSLIIPAKTGLFLDEAFKIADTLMGDEEDLVQKGFGWLLKEESRTKQREVYDYVLARRSVMPRTALRYAIELMPQELRREAMKRVAASEDLI